MTVGGQLLFEWANAGLDKLVAVSSISSICLMPLITSARTLVRRCSKEKSFTSLFLHLDPLHLGPLVAQHAEADGHVGERRGPGRPTPFERAFILVSSGMLPPDSRLLLTMVTQWSAVPWFGLLVLRSI